MRRARVLISGRVQGVWFRASCAERARELGLAGWVRNLADGRVEAAFEGEDRDVASMVDWCRTGPPLADVEAVQTIEEAPTGQTGFGLRGSG